MKKNILMKITLFVLTLFAGLLIMPNKTWAADPTLTLNVDKAHETITATVTDWNEANYKVELDCNGTTIRAKQALSLGGGDNCVVLSLSEVSTFLGVPSSTKTFEITGNIYDAGNGDAPVGTVIPVSGSVYVGRVYVADTADGVYKKEALLVNGEQGGATEYIRTFNDAKEYNSVSVVAKAPYYIATLNKKSTTVTSKISDGPVVFTPGRVIAALSPSASFSGNGTATYNGTISVAPAISEYSEFFISFSDYSDGLTITDPPVVNVGTAGATTITFTGSGSGTATMNLYASDTELSAADPNYLVAAIPKVPIDLSYVPKHYSVKIFDGANEITGGSIIVKPGEKTSNITAKVYYGNDVASSDKQTVDWSISSPFPSGNTIHFTGSKTQTTSVTDYINLEGGVEGSIILTATAAADTESPKASATTTVNISDISINGPKYLVVGGEPGGSGTNRGEYSINAPTGVTVRTVTPTSSPASGISCSQYNPTSKKVYVTALKPCTATVKVEIGGVTYDYPIVCVSVDYAYTSTTVGYPLDLNIGENTTIGVPTGKNIADIINTSTYSFTASPTTNLKSGNSYDPESAGNTTIKLTFQFVDGSLGGYSRVFTANANKGVTFEGTPSKDSVKFDLPQGINRGSGYDKNIPEVTGYQVDIISSNESTVYYTATYNADKYDDIVLNSSTLDSLIGNAGNKMSGDSNDFKIRISPRGKSTDGTVITNYDYGATTNTMTAYKVTVSGDNVQSSTIYGLEGHEIQITAEPNSGYTFSKWKNDDSTKNPRTITVSSTTSKNSYVAVVTKKDSSSSSGSGSGNGTTGKNGSNSNLDKVPKTGENMTVYWFVMIAIFTGSIAAAILYQSVSPKAKKIKSWRGGDTEGGDN